ncbi:MAG: cytochrome c biogenesis protein CcdA [Clostridia bacterium]|nr:MAG: cytochrome c biogenesis protein CcdA [Clostridia bacterium]
MVSGLFAFGGGLVSFVSPCVLPLIPAYVTYLTGSSAAEWGAGGSASRWLVAWRALAFIFGFSLVFVALGASASFIGQLLLGYRDVWQRVAGIFIIAFGIYMTGLIRIPGLYREQRVDYRPRAMGFFPALGLGMAFAVGWTPCVGPVLASILVYAASAQTVGQGVYLLGLYSLGLGLPFFLAALLLGYFSRFRRFFNRYLPHVSLVGGLILVAFGLLVLTGKLQLLTLG